MNIQDIKNAIAAAAAECGAEGYEVKIESSVSAGAEALKDEISSVTYSNSIKMQIRCVKGGKSGYAVGELVTPEEAAEMVKRACDSATVVDDPDEVPLFEGSESYAKVCEEKEEIPSADVMKAHTLELQKKVYAASDKIVDGTQSFTSGASSEEIFFNSAGLDLSYDESIVWHGVAAAARDGEFAEEDYNVQLIRKEDSDSIVKRTVESALSKLGAESVDSGRYNIILDHGNMAMMLAVFSSAFSARAAFLKVSLLAGKEGQKVASDILTITDDPFHPDKVGHCPFDAEGVAVYKKKVIDCGVLNTLLYNRMYAKKFGKETTGNAASATNIEPKGLYIEPGQYSSEALLEKLGNGIYITELKGAHAGADPQSGDFSLEASGFLVENGKKTKPIKNFTVADNWFEFIKKVAAISNEVKFRVGGNYGAPEVMFTDISVAGK